MKFYFYLIRYTHKLSKDRGFMGTYSYTTFIISISKDNAVNANSTIETKMNKKIKKMTNSGWRLVSITPIIRGVKNFKIEYGYRETGVGGWGFGYTDSIMITMEKQA